MREKWKSPDRVCWPHFPQSLAHLASDRFLFKATASHLRATFLSLLLFGFGSTLHRFLI
jgi:hypothetical protein